MWGGSLARMVVGSDVGIGLAALGAGAAAISARAAARGVAFSHRPYVYGEHTGGDANFAKITIRNDGPGTAVDVCWRVYPPGRESIGWSTPIGALQPGEVLPPDITSFPAPVGSHGKVAGWYVETEFSDIRGVRWRLQNEDCQPRSRRRLRRVRSGKLDMWRPS
jgi:hypothetical protein